MLDFNEVLFLTFYSSKNSEKKVPRFHKNIKKHNCFQH